MENDNRKENGEYQFIREQVVSNKRNRVKRMLFSVGFTVLLAIVFGTVARLIFLYSDEPLRRLLGLEEMPGPTPAPAITPPLSSLPSSPEAVATLEGSLGVSGGAEDPSEPGKGDPIESDASGEGEKPGKEENPGESDALGGGSGKEEQIGESGKEDPSEPKKEGTANNPEGQEPASGSGEEPTGEGEPDKSESPESLGSSGDGNEEGKGTASAGYLAMFEEIQNIAGKVNRSLVTVTALVTGIDWMDDPYELVSQTTGVAIEKTAEHLLVLLSLDRIQTASNVQLSIGDEQFDAELWSYDKDYNFAVIAVESSRIPERFWNQIEVARWGELVLPEEGEPIIALGNPNGYIGSMEVGMITSSGSQHYIVDNSVSLFNTDTTDSEFGDGVIANLKGEIIGIITRTLKSDLNMAICTAIGIPGLKNVMAKLAEGKGQVYFGVQGENIPASVLQEEGLNCGIYVMEVKEGSPAHEAGIKTGDIILALDDHEVVSYESFSELLNEHAAGDTVSVLIRRMIRTDPRNVTVKITLSEKQ